MSHGLLPTSSSSRVCPEFFPGCWPRPRTPFQKLCRPTKWTVAPLPRWGLFVLALVAVFPIAASAQGVMGIVYSAPGAYWNDLALCRSLGKLFVLDKTAACVHVFDAQTLAPRGEVDLSSYLPDRPQNLVVHEETGKVYVALDYELAKNGGEVAVVDGAAQTIQTTLTGLGMNLVLCLDQDRDRLYAFSKDVSYPNHRLYAIDVFTDTVAGSLDFTTLPAPGTHFLDRDGGLNPVTGELVFTRRGSGDNSFVVVHGPSLTGQVITAPNCGGWSGVWNWVENKVLIATFTWIGFFTYDRDTGTPGFANCVTDSTYLFFNPTTNRVYSSPEVEGNTVVIEGPADQCREVRIGIGGAKVAFTATKRHVYFASDGSALVRDEDTLSAVAAFPIPGPGGGGVGGASVVVDPSTERVYIRSYRDLSEGSVSCLMAIDDRAPLLTSLPQPQTVWYGQTATLSVAASGVGPVHYQWHQGERGDTSRPVGTDAPTFTTPPLLRSVTYWVRVSDDLGAGDSDAALVTVDPSPGVWTKHPFTLSPAQGMNAVYFVDPSTGWVVGNRGKILKTADGGVTWQAQGGSAYFNEYPNDVWFLDARQGWAVGGSGDGIALRTADGGATWLFVETALRLDGVRFTDALNGWAVGMLGTVLKTVDGGATWSTINVGTSYDLYDLALPDPSTILIVGRGGKIVKSIDGGGHWTLTYAGTENSFYGLFMWDSTHGLAAAGSGETKTGGRIFGTADGGATWVRRSCAADNTRLTAVHCPSDRLGWASGTGGAIFKTVDGGLNWFAQSSGVAVDLNDVFMFGANRGWAVGGEATLLYYTGMGRPDVNLDGLVDAADLTLAAGKLGENPVGWADPPAGDVNRDGRLDALDLVEMGRIVTAPE